MYLGGRSASGEVADLQAGGLKRVGQVRARG